MNPRRMLLIMILIVVVAAAILIIKLNDYKEEEDLLASITEPLPEEVFLPIINGTAAPVDEVKVLVKEEKITVDPDELYMLSHILHGECGSDTCPDEMQIATGSVLLNRIKSDYFPDTMKECIFQKNQYSCTRKGGGYWQEPTERTIANAKWLLENGSQLPEKVLFQSQFKQADGVYKQIGNQYYCYKED